MQVINNIFSEQMNRTQNLRKSCYFIKRFYDIVKEYLDLDRGIFVICVTVDKL